MKKLTLLAALGASLLFTQAAAQGSYPMTITHAAGQTIIPKKPVRVVALLEESAELADALDVKLVGFAGRNEAPLGTRLTQHGYLNMNKLGQPVNLGSGGQPSLETLSALKPDLIVGLDSPDIRTLYPTLSKIAPTLLWNMSADPESTWRTPLRQTARALGKSAAAEKSISQVDLQLRQIRESLAPIRHRQPKVTTIFIRGQRGSAHFSNSAFSRLLTRIGFVPTNLPGLTQGPGEQAAPISGEGLLTLKSDWVLITRPQDGGQFRTDTPYDAVLKKMGMRVVDLHMPADAGSAGPVTDLFRARNIAKLLGVK